MTGQVWGLSTTSGHQGGDHALLSESVSGTADSQAVSLVSKFSMEQEKSKEIEDRISEDGSSDSAPSSANTIYMQSGNRTKALVSMMDQSG